MVNWPNTVAAIFDQSFGRLDQFPAWFAFVALLSAPASLINARVVVRLGMRRMIAIALTAQLACVSLTLVSFALHLPFAGFALFIGLMMVQFFSTGFLIGNLNALALEPMGHVAGMAASVIGGVSTVVAAMIAAALTLLADGTPVPLAASVLVCLVVAAAAMLLARQRPD